MTTYLSSLGALTGNGLVSIENGIAVNVQSNASAGPGVNYFLKDNGAGAFVSTALPTGLSFPTIVVTGLTQQMASNTRYVADNTTGIAVLTLPASPAVGDTVQVSGSGLGSTFNFQIDGSTTQSISSAAGTKTTNFTLTSSQPGCSISMFASSAGTSSNWVVSNASGTFAL
jgi:hypothetical protein